MYILPVLIILFDVVVWVATPLALLFALKQ